MDKQIFSIQRVAACALAFVVTGTTPVFLQAQEEKLTREPVFRQAKLPADRFERMLSEQERPNAVPNVPNTGNLQNNPISQYPQQPAQSGFVRPNLGQAPVGNPNANERQRQREPK